MVGAPIFQGSLMIGNLMKWRFSSGNYNCCQLKGKKLKSLEGHSLVLVLNSLEGKEHEVF